MLLKLDIENLLPILRILLQHLQLLTVKDEQVDHHFTCFSIPGGIIKRCFSLLIVIFCRAVLGDDVDKEQDLQQDSVSPGLVEGNGTELKPKNATYVPNIPGRSQAVGWLDNESSFCRSKASTEAPENDSDIVLNGKVDFLNVSKKTKEERNQHLNTYLSEQQVLSPTCATDDFNTWAYCAKANFYGVNGINKTFFGGEKPPNQIFKDMAEFDKYGFMQDMVLLLVDGCVSCKNSAGKQSELNLSVAQLYKPRRQAGVCPGYLNYYTHTDVQLDKGKASFVYGVVLKERLCPMVGIADVLPNKTNLVIEPLDYKYEISLVVTHNCTGKEKNVSLKIPTIDVFTTDQTMHDRVMQIRGLKLDLDTLEDGVLDLSNTDNMDLNGHFILGTIASEENGPTMPPPSPNDDGTVMPPMNNGT
uniref:Uncharacterized protein n=1 Tax=Globodera rostochiensis TaxID=31243 RepID=A0A914IBJ4_GLORO